jgi:hypothetical protein
MVRIGHASLFAGTGEILAWEDLTDTDGSWGMEIVFTGCQENTELHSAVAAGRIVYTRRPCDDNFWRFSIVDAATNTSHDVETIFAAPYFEAPAPLVEADDEIYALAYAQPLAPGTVKTIVEIHALADDALLWSIVVPGRVWSLSVGGSRVLLSYAPGGSVADPGAQSGSADEVAWTDSAHREQQIVGQTWGAPALSHDGSAAAWFDAGFGDCRVLHVESLSGAPARALDTEVLPTGFRHCTVGVDADGGRTTVVWCSSDPDLGRFVGVLEADGSGYALVGLPYLSWIGLQGRTVIGATWNTADWIVLDLDRVRVASTSG